MFNPLTDMPENDKQAEIVLQRSNELLTKILYCLYKGYRAQGKTVLEAFQLTLEQHVAAPEGSRDQ